MANAESDPASQPPRRAAANAFIALFLLVQIAVPLTYYLGARVEDERFGWRMFSTVRLRDCDVSAADRAQGSASEHPIALGSTLHIAWINLLKRGRTAVVHDFLRYRCAEAEVSEVAVERRCRDTDGTLLPPDRTSIECASGQIHEAP